ncbi:Thioesterase/thiol ester dehydrase-isomerase [Wolfiporia cocos MD-104 SS10]|uniref:Thioesterase/thiol ester dehydrase-isomerase n=1 Tax=Wolfiporia cocos (strain MD-104) TaxID=742152 RepID=A0A2H3JSR5_WOLCO|nr:Thioesterase/thiol ester dehydrase-isomerase [Wolfiporia cocos MD-104 SS10]
MRHLQRHLAVAASDAALPRCRSVLRRAQVFTAFARSQNRHHSGSSIRSLQDAFRDPSSPFHIAPGTQGPASPDPPSEAELLHTNAINEDEMTEAAERARRTLIDLGYDPSSFWEQRIVWGDHDAFQHVNNVRYVRFFESSRVEWMVSLGRELGGEARARDMLTGRGVSLILKSISVDYKRPVVYPDTLLVAKRPRVVSRLPKTHFNLEGAAYSYRQGRVVTECDSVMVWYDYDKLAKCDPGEEARRVLLSRIALCAEQKQ